MKAALKSTIARKGLHGNKFFATLSFTFALLRFVQRLAGTAPKTLYTHKMKPGEAIVVTQLSDEGKGKKRKGKDKQVSVSTLAKK